MRKTILSLATATAALLGLVPGTFAADVAEGTVPEGAKVLVAKLQAIRPDLPIERVLETPVANMYGLALPDGTVLYGTADGKHLFAGDLYALGTELVNLTESSRAVQRRGLLAGMPVDDMVVFSPEEERKASIYVFTDVDCGYCRKLHQEMAELNARGIEVRYLAYPRAGVGSDSYQKIVSAWCADDPQSALTALKAGQVIPSRSCPNPVAAHYDLGRQVGISGTPAILTEDGRLFPGYMPAAQLAATIGVQ